MKIIKIFHSREEAEKANLQEYAKMSYIEKISLIENLRQLQIKLFPKYGTEQRLQRVCRVVKPA